MDYKLSEVLFHMNMRHVYNRLSKEAAAEINETAKVEHCVLVIRNNIDFFIDMLRQPESIASCLSMSMDEVKNSPLVQAISNAFANDKLGMLWVSMALFRNAILGNPEEPDSGLINGEGMLLETYLRNNPLMLQAILKNQGDPLLEKWKEKNHVLAVKEQKILRNISVKSVNGIYPDTIAELKIPVTNSSSPKFFEPSKVITSEEMKSEQEFNPLSAAKNIEKEDSSCWKTLGLFAAGACVAAVSVIAGIGLINNKMK